MKSRSRYSPSKSWPTKLGTRPRLQPAFRHKRTREIVITPGIHNIYTIAEVADAADVDRAVREWEPGFADAHGNFWNSELTHKVFGVDDSQELHRMGVVP